MRKLFAIIMLLCCTVAWGQDAEGRKLLAKAEAGDAYAQMVVGLSYQIGSNGFPKDDEEAVKWLKRAASNGDEHSNWELGWYYKDFDKDQAIYWFKKDMDAVYARNGEEYKYAAEELRELGVTYHPSKESTRDNPQYSVTSSSYKSSRESYPIIKSCFLNGAAATLNGRNNPINSWSSKLSIYEDKLIDDDVTEYKLQKTLNNGTKRFVGPTVNIGLYTATLFINLSKDLKDNSLVFYFQNGALQVIPMVLSEYAENKPNNNSGRVFIYDPDDPVAPVFVPQSVPQIDNSFSSPEYNPSRNNDNTTPQQSQRRICNPVMVGDMLHCGGSGRCARCNGSGVADGFGLKNQQCTTCGGSGRCPSCHGTGYLY